MAEGVATDLREVSKVLAPFVTSQRAEFGASKNSKGRTFVIYKKKPFVSFLDIQAFFKTPSRSLSSLLVTYVFSSKGHFRT